MNTAQQDAATEHNNLHSFATVSGACGLHVIQATLETKWEKQSDIF
jgi:hypothetical protein